MNDQTNQNSFSERHEERRQRRLERRSGGWIGGVFLAFLGVILLLQNLKIYTLNNWWALFILLPAAGSLATGVRLAQADGKFSARARGSLIAGVMFILVTGMFLFSLNWTILGPALLILAGISLIVNMIIPG
jgi:drug/metabolite transporter (DMT)-like permease